RMPWKKLFHLRNATQLLFQVSRHGVRVLGVPEPCAFLKHSDPRCRDEAHLGSKLAGLFAAILEFLRELTVEENDRLAQSHPVLRSAKAKHLPSRLPGNLAR